MCKVQTMITKQDFIREMRILRQEHKMNKYNIIEEATRQG